MNVTEDACDCSSRSNHSVFNLFILSLLFEGCPHFPVFLYVVRSYMLLTLFRFLNDTLESFSIVLQVSVNASVIGFHVLYQLKPVDFLLKQSDHLNSLLH